MRSQDPPRNLSALYSKGSVEGWLYAQLPICKEEFGFYPPMKIVQGDFKWMISKHKPWETTPTSFEFIELDLLYKECSEVCRELRAKECTYRAVEEGGEGIPEKSLACNSCEKPKCQCAELDNQVAARFLGKTGEMIYSDTFSNEIVEAYSLKREQLKGYSKTPELFAASYSRGDHPVLTYFCPRTFMMEVLSPIVIDEIVIGVLITGQVIPENTFDAVRKKCDSQVRGLVKKYIDEDEQTLNPRILGDEKKARFIEHFRNEAKRQQTCLQQRSDRNWDHFSLRKVSEFSEELSKKTSDDNQDRIVGALELLPTWISGVQYIVYYKRHTKKYVTDMQLIPEWSSDSNAAKLFKDRIPTANLAFELIRPSPDDSTILVEGNTILIHGASEKYPISLEKVGIGKKPMFILYYDHDHTIGHAFLMLLDEKLQDWATHANYSRLLKFLNCINGELSFMNTMTELDKSLKTNKKELDGFNSTLRVVGHELAQQCTGADSMQDMIGRSWQEVIDQSTKYAPPDVIEFLTAKNDMFNERMLDLQSTFAYINFLSKMIQARASIGDHDAKKDFYLQKECFSLIKTAFRVRTDDKRVKLQFAIDENISIIKNSSYFHFQMMLMNLVSNAVKYCYGGTHIYVSAALKSKRVDHDIERFLCIRVRNFGGIIPKCMREEIFEKEIRLCNITNPDTGRPYQETKEDGSGYGLYLVRECVEKLGGKCVIEPYINKYGNDREEDVPVAKYNLPLLDACFSEKAKSKMDRARQTGMILQEDYENMLCLYEKRSVKTHPYNRILYKAIWPMQLGDTPRVDSYISGETFGSLLRKLTNSMYETVFTVSIPVKVKFGQKDPNSELNVDEITIIGKEIDS